MHTTSSDLLAVTGVGPVDERGRVLHEGDLVAQIALAVANVEQALAMAGLTTADLLALTLRTVDPVGVRAVLDVVTDHLEAAGSPAAVDVVPVARLAPGMALCLDGRASRDHTHSIERNHDMTTPTLDPTVPSGSAVAAQRLHGLCGAEVAIHLPGDPGYDEAARPWNVAVAQRPAAVAVPETAEQAALVVRVAARLGLRIAPQGTGHAAGALANQRLDDAVLVRTHRMQAVVVDADGRTARAEAGAEWQHVMAAATPHGLVALHGSSPDVGVVGYALGGGMGWYARRHGLAATHVSAVELVTADGSLVRADATTRPDLFWAVRGGGAANFGLVTAVELRLFPIPDAYAGLMLWPLERLEPVLRTWVAWAAEAPESVTTSFRVMRFPDLPHLPPFLRGRSVVLLDGAVLEADERAGEMLAPFRELAPELDSFGRIPAEAVTRMHMDPEGPTPAVADGLVLEAFDEAGIRAFLDAAGPGSATRLLCVELRQLGGAVSRPAPDGGALACVPGAYALFALGPAPVPALAEAARADLAVLLDRLSPWQAAGSYLNLTERAVPTDDAFGTATARRLRAVRAEVDPAGVFVANHPVG